MVHEGQELATEIVNVRSGNTYYSVEPCVKKFTGSTVDFKGKLFYNSNWFIDFLFISQNKGLGLDLRFK